ncbi:hypothetical protein ACWDO0_34425 [Nocardia rhamnosiphila]
MTLNDTPETVSMIGPVRYDLWVKLPNANPDDDDIGFVVNGLALPRVGDDLTFEGKAEVLLARVTRVGHVFFPTDDEAPRRLITVHSEAFPISHGTVEKLRDESELARWVEQFPMLESY